MSAIHGFDYNLNAGYTSDSSYGGSMDTTPKMPGSTLHGTNKVPVIKVRDLLLI